MQSYLQLEGFALSDANMEPASSLLKEASSPESKGLSYLGDRIGSAWGMAWDLQMGAGPFPQSPPPTHTRTGQEHRAGEAAASCTRTT